MLEFFRRLFRMASAPVPSQASHLPSIPVPASLTSDVFDPVWELVSSHTLATAPGIPRITEDHAELLAPKVLGHFQKHHPDPASFPALAMQIMTLVHEPDLDMNHLIRTISPDPAIGMHVLRAANSAMYNRGMEVQDLRRAVLQIGFREVGDIAAGVAGRTLFDLGLKAEFEVFGSRWTQLFLDTMAVAFGASRFAFEHQVGRADHAFLAGMFHDIGKSLALRSLAAMVLEGEVEAPIPEAVVDEVLERVHIPVGSELHTLWGLPDYLAEACLHHHDPELPMGLEHTHTHILRLVEGFHRLILDPNNVARLQETRQSLKALNLTRQSARRLYLDMGDHIERVKVLFS